MHETIKTDIIIIGAGPVGLFTVFEAGLLKLKCHLIDALPQVGGQLTEIYPKKPIYDIPGCPAILASDLIKNLLEQIKPFKPTFTLGDRAQSIERLPNNHFRVVTSRGEVIEAPVITIAGGLGSFEPRKPPIENIANYEDKGVEYMVRDPQFYKHKDIVIAGGGDSALDWTIYLADVAKNVTLIHRRNEFRGTLDSVEKVMQLRDAGKIKIFTQSEVIGLSGKEKLSEITIKHDVEGLIQQKTQHFIPLFGLSPKLGPIADWQLNVEKNAVEVNTFDYSTNVPGIFAVGDINTYPGKLKLILCGFHEGALAMQSAFKIVHPDKKLSFKYTTVTGVEAI